MVRVTLIISFLCGLAACERPAEQVYFPFFVDELTMIWNIEQDNSIEGEYITVLRINEDTVRMKLPPNFRITDQNKQFWMLGFGNDVKYNDNGSENLFGIRDVDSKKQLIILGERLKGSRELQPGETICFFRNGPAGTKKISEKPLIDVKRWPGFVGKSVHMGFIEFDKKTDQFVMYFNEVGQDSVSIYLAGSRDLKEWYPLNNGAAIYSAADFNKTTWAGWDPQGERPNSPFISDAILHKGIWHLFLYGYNRQGERSIGMIQTKTLIKPGEILKEPIITPSNHYDQEGVFYPKVTRSDNSFYLAYDGISKKDVEGVCLATSNNLLEWNKSEFNPVIMEHSGWRSSTLSSEPNYIQVQNDTFRIMVSGTKAFKDNLWHRRVTGSSWKDVPGNVADAQLGVYLSTDGGRSFIAHQNNPIMINDYSDPLENEHMGGNFELIKTDSVNYVLYQTKSNKDGLNYNLQLRALQNSKVK